jgi:hypothetical protein
MRPRENGLWTANAIADPIGQTEVAFELGKNVSAFSVSSRKGADDDQPESFRVIVLARRGLDSITPITLKRAATVLPMPSCPGGTPTPDNLGSADASRGFTLDILKHSRYDNLVAAIIKLSRLAPFLQAGRSG